MTRGPFRRGEPDFTRVKSIATGVSALAILALTLLLMVWMIAQVAEHPGVPREVGKLPRWFAGESAVHGARERVPAPAAAAHGHEAGVAIASIKPGTPAARAPSSKAAADDGFVEVAGARIEIALSEYKMKPDKIRAKPGAVTFVLSNVGRFAHDFHIEGPGVDAYAAKFSPGRTVHLEVTLQEGEYKISCPLSNHDQRGMNITLVATSKLTGK